MSATKYFAKAFQLLKSVNFGNKTEEIHSPNELIDSRFEISKNDPIAQKKVPNSLLFLMYSKENETLFI